MLGFHDASTDTGYMALEQEGGRARLELGQGELKRTKTV